MKTILKNTSLASRAARTTIQARAKTKLARTVFSLPKKEEPTSIQYFCVNYQVTKEALTRMTGFSPRAVANWSSGKHPSASAQKKLTELTRLFDALCELIDPKTISLWLKTTNPAFEGSTPLQIIERGEIDRIWKMIWQLESGNLG